MKRKWCYGKMDLYITEDCKECDKKTREECWKISFRDYLK